MTEDNDAFPRFRRDRPARKPARHGRDAAYCSPNSAAQTMKVATTRLPRCLLALGCLTIAAGGCGPSAPASDPSAGAARAPIAVQAQNQNPSGTPIAFASNIPDGHWRFGGVSTGVPFWISTDKPRSVGRGRLEIELIAYDASLPPIVWQESRWYVDCRTRSTMQVWESLLDNHFKPARSRHLKSGKVDDEMSSDYVPGSEDAEVVKAACAPN
jgi:hypothetical protein